MFKDEVNKSITFRFLKILIRKRYSYLAPTVIRYIICGLFPFRTFLQINDCYQLMECIKHKHFLVWDVKKS